ncbi:MAG: hypothetical protein ACRCWQ_03400 [Bacilli bacterium]
MSHADLDKDKRINAEKRKLSSLLKNLDTKKKKAVASLIENAAFMSVTLQDLQIAINEEGPVEEYQNGENQSGRKVSSNVQVYNTMIKNYMSAVKQLTDLLPKDVPVNSEDAFDAFLTEREL